MERARSDYVVVTPARNEEENIVYTIESMSRQTALPSRWVIVDDGSSDRTGQIIDAAAREIPWILALHRKDRGCRKQGGGVIETFYDGYELVRSEPWQFVVKFDADLSFEAEYFERCLTKFAKEPRLGIGGGLICEERSGRLVCESPSDPGFHVRGATKIYRRTCWDQIGGLIRAAGWDTVDELKANMLGWKTCSFPDVPLRHHRFTGTADGALRTWFKNGVANYVAGYHPLFMFLKCLRRISERPYLMASAALACGYFGGRFNGVHRVDDPDLVRYVRRQQLNKLLLRPSLW
ncbi:MAG: glycosyltransferase family 2 protein [Verrucomicrobia bacterium]|nr:glycosyltransferase family 2 protein [Verrucomicrobiota bacterium]